MPTGRSPCQKNTVALWRPFSWLPSKIIVSCIKRIAVACWKSMDHDQSAAYRRSATQGVRPGTSPVMPLDVLRVGVEAFALDSCQDLVRDLKRGGVRAGGLEGKLL